MKNVSPSPLALCAQHTVSTPLGAMLLAANHAGLAGAWFEGQKHHPGPIAAAQDPDHPSLRAAARALEAYWAGGALQSSVLKLAPQGSAFAQAVWQALQKIPSGSVLSYGDLALQLGRASAVRAVAQAVARNPLSLFVPCHRVLGQGGQLTGYAGGLQRKRALLQLEGVALR